MNIINVTLLVITMQIIIIHVMNNFFVNFISNGIISIFFPSDVKVIQSGQNHYFYFGSLICP